jgi:chromosome segregation ATPase
MSSTYDPTQNTVQQIKQRQKLGQMAPEKFVQYEAKQNLKTVQQNDKRIMQLNKQHNQLSQQLKLLKEQDRQQRLSQPQGRPQGQMQQMAGQIKTLEQQIAQNKKEYDDLVRFNERAKAQLNTKAMQQHQHLRNEAHWKEQLETPETYAERASAQGLKPGWNFGGTRQLSDASLKNIISALKGRVI